MEAKGRAGFTLIELLVVIAIIAILAAILFPLFKEAKIAGKRSVCIQHQREVGVAVCLYADDNNGTYPYTTRQRTKQLFPKYPDNVNTTISGELIFLLNPYGKNQQVHYCTMVDTYSKECNRNTNPLDVDYMELTYTWQSKLSPPFMYTGYYYYAGEGWAGMPVKQNGNPKRILLSCIGGVGSTNGVANKEGMSGHGQARGVYVFADGHAKYLKHYHYPITKSECEASGDTEYRKLLMPRWKDY